MKIKKKAILESLDAAAALYRKEMPAEAAVIWLYNILELNKAAADIRREIEEDTAGQEEEERIRRIVAGIEEEEMQAELRRLPVRLMGDCRVSPALLHRVMFLLE